MNHYILILEANASENELDYLGNSISDSILTLLLFAPSAIAITKSMLIVNAINTTVAATYQNSNSNL